MRMRALVLTVALGLVLAGTGFAQGLSTGKITGVVTTTDGGALPGATVTITSPALQGTRVAVTRDNGSFVFPNLPAGDYEASVEAEGFESQQHQVKVAVAQTRQLDVSLGVEAVTEQIVVSSEVSTISEGIASQSTYTQDMVDKLTVPRTVSAVTYLAPGVQTVPGLRGGLSISGSETYQSLYMVNGVTVNENVRGQPLDLYIEDAVEETTIQQSGVSAEYGRFSGGVINAITKSGGNQFTGSFRASIDNEDWEARTPLTTAQEDEVNETYEATLGGRIIRDRVWFFLAGRDLERSSQTNLQRTNIAIPQDATQERQELKLTVSPHPSHSLVGTIQNRDQKILNTGFSPVDLSTLSDREDPQELFAGNYTGIFTPNFFFEVQHSERDFTIAKGSGANTTERIGGTWIVDLTEFTFIGSPVFCGVCTDEQRNNENSFAKASYFLTSDKSGTHDLVAGYDTFSDIVIVENHQSGSDFSVWAFQPFIYRGQQVFPQINGGFGNLLIWNPVLNPTQGTDFETNAFFVNDAWRMNDHWSFNLGFRYDINDAVDAGGAKISDDDKVSPRFGATYDLKGDGSWVFNASFGTYVHQVHSSGNTGNGAASGGALSEFDWLYGGPDINPDPNAPTDQLVNADEAIQIIFNWFAAIGDTNNRSFLVGQDIPGVGTQILSPLASPHSEELTFGVSKRLGSRGLVRTDYVHREFKDFYVTRTDLTTGKVTNPDGTLTDLSLIENNDSLLERTYDGLHTQFHYRVNDRLNVAGNWTWSHARGNTEGETRDNGPLTSDIVNYPEYRAFNAFAPVGDLQVDQRHKVRLWAIWDAIRTDHNSLSLSLLQRFDTGHPYGAQGVVDSGAFLPDFGYIFPPTTVDYHFTNRDAFRTDDITRTDFAVNYSFQIKGVSFFLQPEILNIFNEDGVIDTNTTVRDRLAPFDPFTETPVEGVHWEKGPSFGQPVEEADFQTPRIFRFSVGFRF